MAIAMYDKIRATRATFNALARLREQVRSLSDQELAIYVDEANRRTRELHGERLAARAA